MILLVTALALFSVVATVTGIVLAFKASIVLGIIVLFVEPAPTVIGVVYLLTGTDLAIKILEYLQ